MGPLLWAGGAAVPHDLVLGAQHGLDKTSTAAQAPPSEGIEQAASTHLAYAVRRSDMFGAYLLGKQGPLNDSFGDANGLCVYEERPHAGVRPGLERVANLLLVPFLNYPCRCCFALPCYSTVSGFATRHE